MPVESPLTGYVGRFLDSGQTVSRFTYPRTTRARMVKVAPERDMIYMIMSGSTFVGQQLSTFADRVATEPLQTMPGPVPPFGEKFLAFQKSFAADQPFSGWPTPSGDGEERLMDFDWDDRGYNYLAYGPWGWGILDDATFSVVSVRTDLVSPEHIYTYRVGSTYYAAVSNFSQSRIYNVTNPASPFQVGSGPAFGEWAKSTTSIARIEGVNLVITGPPSQFFAAPPGSAYADVTTDGTNFYALLDYFDGNTADVIEIIKPSGLIYTSTQQTAAPRLKPHIAYGLGYLTVPGFLTPSGQTFYIYSVGANSITLLNSTYFDWMTGIIYASHRIAQPVMIDDVPTLIDASYGIGDVFTLAAPSPLTVTKAFTPGTIMRGETSTLTITINNPNPTPVTSFNLSDTYPAAVVNASTSASTTCTVAGTFAVSQGGSSFTLSGATLAANSSCTVTIQVTSNTAGTHTNTIPAGAVDSIDNTNAASADADLIVTELPPPTVSKAFASSSTVVGTPVRMTITLTNPNSTTITNVALTDNYPVGLVNATPPNASTTCGGTVIAAAGGSTLSLSGGAIPAMSSCTVSVDVVATSAGPITNTLPAGAVTSSNAAASAAAASATLNAVVAGSAPTLSQWALIALTALLGALALVRLRT